MGEEESPSGKWQKRFSGYREELLRLALLGIPVWAITELNNYLKGKLFNQPWQAVWFLVPIGILVWVLWQGLKGRADFRLDRRFLAFLGAYILLFSIAARSGFLDWSRDLTVFGMQGPRSWLTPVGWGDWRYALAPRKPDPRDELLIVLLEPAAGRSREQARKDIVDLIALAKDNESKGVALDFYFDGDSAIDRLLCHAIANAGIPVIAGYGFDRSKDGRIVESPIPVDLKPCLTEKNLGHLAGFLDTDSVSRLTPLFFRNDPERPSLGLLVAKLLAGDTDLALPSDGLLRFVEPAKEWDPVIFKKLPKSEKDLRLLRQRFVVAGENSDRDSFETPFGRRKGVLIHADQIHSLRQGHFIRAQSWWLGFAFTLAFCYWLAAWCANGAPAARLVLLCAGATVCLVAVAVVSILTGPYWFDVVYPVAAVWLLLPLLLGLRRTIPAK